MLDIADVFMLVLSAGSLSALLISLAIAARDERRVRPVETRICCPRTGSDVNCTLLHDEQRGTTVRLARCSGSNPNGLPTCDQDCVRLMNLGIPLRPARPPRRAPRAS